MPTFNEARFVECQLNALASQDYSGDWYVIVADNGSGDGTIAIASAWENRLPLRVVDASIRRGCAAARNIGVDESDADAFLFCDGDDIVDPGWLSAHAASLESSDLSAGSLIYFRNHPKPISALPKQPPTLLGWLPYAQGANLAVRRSTYELVGGFNEANASAEDVEFSWCAQLAGCSFAYTSSAIVHKRVRSHSRAIFKQYYRYGKSDVDLFRRFRAHGAARPPATGLVKTYAGLLARLPGVGSPDIRERWLHQAGRRCGRLVASVELRTFFP
jgi:glycosyltransferase involved in cell wall biosynthesis